MSDIADLRRRMEGALKTLQQELTGLRTGRASPNLLDSVTVDAYGSTVPLNQVANVSVPEPRLLTVNVWDKGMVKAVEKGIAAAGLGLNPQADGSVIRVPLPELTQERRQELVKVGKRYGEDAKISVRNIRRDGMEHLKKLEKDGKISKDDHQRQADDIQKLTDEFVKKADDAVSAKEKEILTV